MKTIGIVEVAPFAASAPVIPPVDLITSTLWATRFSGKLKGLIAPARTQGGSRRYSERDIALLRRIQELTNEGVSLVGVRKILDLEDQLARARRDLVDAVEQVRREHRRDLVPISRPAKSLTVVCARGA